MNIRKVLGTLVIAVAAGSFTLAASAQSNDPVIQQRKLDQQGRIAQGVQSGQLTPHETANLETKEAALNRETRAMRAENGGKLTPGDKALVTHQQNTLSRQIYRDKHNAAKE